MTDTTDRTDDTHAVRRPDRIDFSADPAAATGSVGCRRRRRSRSRPSATAATAPAPRRASAAAARPAPSRRSSSSAPGRPGSRRRSTPPGPTSSRSSSPGRHAGGQLMITSDVENYPGFPDGIQGPDLMARFREQAERFGTRIVDVDVERVDFSERPFRLWARGVEYRAQSVIVATGASAIWLGLESETRLRGRGVQRLRDLRRLLLPRQGDRGRRRRRHRPRGGDLPDPLRHQGPPAPPARRVPRQPDHAGPGARQPEDRDPPRTPRSRRSSATSHVEALRLRDTVTGAERDDAGRRPVRRDRPQAQHRGLPRLARGRREGLSRRPRPDRRRRSTACSSPATSTTTATARP